MTNQQATHPMLAGGPPPPPTATQVRQGQADAEHRQRLAQSHANQRAQQRGDAIDKLEGSAGGVKALGWAVAILGIVAGIGLCAWHDDTYEQAHSLAGVGVATALFSVVIGSVLIMLAHWADAWSKMQR